MNLDFQPPLKASARRRRSRGPARILLVLLVAMAALVLLIQGNRAPTEAHLTDQDPAEKPPPVLSEPPPPPVPEVQREVVAGTINPGDTVTALLGPYFSPQEIHSINSRSKEVFPLSRICAGQPYKLCTVDGAFERFEYDIDRNEQLIIRQEDGEVAIERVPIDYTVETVPVRGTITTSLFEAVEESGETAELAMSLADIFAWDIDFILDIRQGDSFQALVEKRYREGKPAGYGNILAAEFTNQGKNFQAFLYQDGDRRPSYYDAEGNNVRKAFLRAPLSFTRISSGFTMRRYHPITKTWKAHPAIDYAAPRGTPIKSVGDGTIIRIGYTKYNGNYIKVRHNSTYQTLYLHMSGFAKGMKKGKRISQGQTIGYVGSTGLATGPHLCFRMYRNGSPVNPNRVREPAAPPVAEANLADFKFHAGTLLASLQGLDTQQAALNVEESAPAGE